MKFGKQLETLALPKFRGYYVRYKELKKAIKVFTGQERTQATVEEVTHWTSNFLRLGPNPNVPPEARLQEVLQAEVDRVSKFAELEEGSLRSQLAQLAEESKSCSGTETNAALRRKLNELGEGIVQLHQFAQLNFSGFRKVLKKYDKWSGSSVMPWFMPKVARAPMMTVKYDELITTLSSIASNLRSSGAPIQTPSATPAVGPTKDRPDLDPSFKATGEMVFLVDPKDTIWVKVELAKRMDWTAAAWTAPGSSQQERTHMSVLDTSDLAVYRSCVSGTSTPLASVHLRRSNNDLVSVAHSVPGQERAEVLVSHAEVSKLLAGRTATPSRPSFSSLNSITRSEVLSAVSPKMEAAAEETLRAAGSTVSAAKLAVVASASYMRSVGVDKADEITFLLDEDVRMGQMKEWDKPPATSETFPYDVLTFSLSPAAQSKDLPKWISRVYNSAQLLQVSGFSKAAHAVARCHLVNAQLPEPHWYRQVTLKNEEIVEEDHPVEEQASHKARAPTDESDVALPARMPSTPALRPAAVPSNPNTMMFQEGPASRYVHEFGYSIASQGLDCPRSRQVSGVSGGPTLGARVNDLAAPLLAPNDLTAPLLQKPVAEPPLQAKSSAKTSGVSKWLHRFGIGGSRDLASDSKPVRTAIVAVQPKTLYSNERTFLEWMHFTVVISSLGLLLLHGGPAGGPTAETATIGRFLLVVAILLVVWSLHTFNWRAEALNSKEARDYSDPVGPLLLILGMIVALCCSALHALGILQFGGTQLTS